MKSILFSFVVSCFFFFNLLAQTYVPFPKDSVHWRIVKTARDPTFPDNTRRWYCFLYLKGDTIIDSVLYSKLYENIYPSFVDSARTEKFKGVIREKNKRVYYAYEADLSKERLLYDFNLSVGDTMLWDNLYINDDWSIVSQPAVVYAIDSVQMANGEYRKRYDLGYTVIIEGIGNVRSSLLWAHSQPALDYAEGFQCVSYPNELIYKRIGVDDDDCFAVPQKPINIEEVDNELFSIYPNPNTGKLFFSEAIQEFEIFSLLGLSVYSQKEINTKTIDISFLSKGIYFLKAKGKTTQLFKLIKN